MPSDPQHDALIQSLSSQWASGSSSTSYITFTSSPKKPMPPDKIPNPLKGHPYEAYADDAKPCCIVCGTNALYGAHQMLIDGKMMRWGLCLDCHGLEGHRVGFCPTCMDVHVYPNEWYANTKAKTFLPVPCQEHSVSEDFASVECAVCGCVEASDIKMSKRGITYCMDCYAETIKCSAPYCHSRIHPDHPDVAKSPGGYNFYCVDCSFVKSKPAGVTNAWHPLTWDYVEGCPCSACKYLAGKHKRWPKGPSPEDEVEKHECYFCDSLIFNPFMHTSNGLKKVHHICHSCEWQLTECDNCGEKKVNHEFMDLSSAVYNALNAQTPHNSSVCNSCIDHLLDDVWLCDFQCNTWFPSFKDCDCDGVYPYNYTPSSLSFFHAMRQISKPQKVPYLGVEIEVEDHKHAKSRKQMAREIREIVGDFTYCVHDGSLKGTKPDGTGGQHGFEIVTYPFTYEWYQENWDRFERLLWTLRSQGYRSWDGGRCGMHIHISRKPMSEAHQMRFIRFIYGSVNLMLCVGQRSYRSNLNKYAPFHGEDRSNFIQKIRDYINPGVHSHYAALNANKPHTLEARWMRGTLNPKSFSKNVEFIQSVWEFTKQYGFNSANEINYMRWLSSAPQSRRFSSILDYLEREYVTRQ